MKKYNNFYIHAASFYKSTLEVHLSYSFDKEKYFTETIQLDSKYLLRKGLDSSVIDNILFHISIAFGISYYKIFPTKDIIIESAKIDYFQATYWKNFYTFGLGEFFYTNKIDFRGLCNFISHGNTTYKKVDFSLSDQTLLPIGGGKDSIVSAYLFQEEGKKNITPFIFGKSDAIKDNFLKIYGSEALVIKRQLDPELFVMNTKGYYNGHVPITGLISYFMSLVCYLYDFKYIAFSNEKSADSGNTVFHENEINHQYSKSNDFEKNFSEYVSKYISSDIVYYSKLRDLYEIQIAKIFAENCKEYFDIFSSCNKNFSITKNSDTRWCNSCPKCLFVYIILRPFLSKSETLQIFGEELYQRGDLEILFLEIIGENGIKPFECVGEENEARLASHLALTKMNGNKTPVLLEIFEALQKNNDNSLDINRLRKKYNI